LLICLVVLSANVVSGLHIAHRGSGTGDEHKCNVGHVDDNTGYQTDEAPLLGIVSCVDSFGVLMRVVEGVHLAGVDNGHDAEGKAAADSGQD